MTTEKTNARCVSCHARFDDEEMGWTRCAPCRKEDAEFTMENFREMRARIAALEKRNQELVLNAFWRGGRETLTQEEAAWALAKVREKD